jgi:twitching motility two-component system response regulator PilH
LHLKFVMAATVLIVDDNPDIRNVLASYLYRSGHQVLEAANGAMGIQRATAESPNFVLLDLYLPDMNGLEVARTLRKTPVTQHIPIVGWTVDCRATMYREALAAGYIDFCLDKPVSVSVIEALVERYAKQEC